MMDSDILFVLTDNFRYGEPTPTDQPKEVIMLCVTIHGNGIMFTDMHFNGDWLEVEHTDILNTDRHNCEHLGRLIVYRLYIKGADGKYSVPIHGFECSRCGKDIS